MRWRWGTDQGLAVAEVTSVSTHNQQAVGWEGHKPVAAPCIGQRRKCGPGLSHGAEGIHCCQEVADIRFQFACCDRKRFQQCDLHGVCNMQNLLGAEMKLRRRST